MVIDGGYGDNVGSIIDLSGENQRYCIEEKEVWIFYKNNGRWQVIFKCIFFSLYNGCKRIEDIK
jgi:hypothetical protein